MMIGQMSRTKHLLATSTGSVPHLQDNGCTQTETCFIHNQTPLLRPFLYVDPIHSSSQHFHIPYLT